MKILVATGFYYETSESSDEKPKNTFRGNSACKNIEFFDLWYRHVRHFLPEADMFILDNGSPIPFNSISSQIPEDIYCMDESLMTHFNRKLNTFRFDERLKHNKGWCRQISAILDVALLNDYDYLIYVEADALLGFDPAKYLGYDFVSASLTNHGAGVGVQGKNQGAKQCFMMIKKEMLPNPALELRELYQKIERENLDVERFPGPPACAHRYIHDLYFAEHGFKKYFWTDSSCTLSKDDLFLHDGNKQQLNEFLTKTNI